METDYPTAMGLNDKSPPVGLFTWSCQQARSKGVLTSKELSAIEPKRERCSCVFTCASERVGWVFGAAGFRLAALASRVN